MITRISTIPVTEAFPKRDVRITCYEGEVHGYENLEQAFVHSCNGAFAQIGMEVNNDSYRKLCESFLFNKDLPIDLPSSQSLFRLSSNASYGEEMMTAIGQGETVVSPFEEWHSWLQPWQTAAL